MAFRAAADARAADENPVAIHMHRLLRDTHEHDHRPARRKLRIPPVLARFECSGWFTGRCAFGVKRWLLHSLRCGEEPNGNGKYRQEFHKVIRTCTVITTEKRSFKTSCCCSKFRKNRIHICFLAGPVSLRGGDTKPFDLAGFGQIASRKKLSTGLYIRLDC